MNNCFPLILGASTQAAQLKIAGALFLHFLELDRYAKTATLKAWQC